MPHDWHTFKRIALNALDLPAGRRRDYVIQTCGHNDALCGEVLAVVDIDPPRRFLDPPLQIELVDPPG